MSSAFTGTPAFPSSRTISSSHVAVSYPWFDWLRFGLASIVALTHASLLPWDQGGSIAVQVFFALSGFLIGGILLRSTARDLPRFFFNRATRIWVPYFIALVLLYSLSALRQPVNLRWLEFLAYDLTFTHNLFFLKPDPTAALQYAPLGGTGNHFWSIAVEEQFYLGAPLLMFATRWGKSLWLWLALSLFFVGTASWFGAISLGVASAIARREFGDWYLAPKVRAGLFGLIALVVLAMAVGLPGLKLMVPFFAIAVVLVVAREGPRSGVGEFFGGLSYPLYLNHWVAVYAVHALWDQLGLPRAAISEATAYVIAVAGAGLHFHFIDSPLLASRPELYTLARGRALRSMAYLLLMAGLAIGVSSWGVPYWG